MAVSIGELIEGKYRVVRLLGTGGMGSVYEGENILISRRVAIKVLHPEMMQKKTIVARFEQEARAAGRIRNDHINEVIDISNLEDGSKYIVLEFLDGETLKDRVKRVGRLTPMQAVHVVRQVLIGLSAAHRAGVIHRDLKPGNIFILWEKLGQRDFVKIIDFGVSKFIVGDINDPTPVDKSNTLLGTPHYMAPEQIRHSADVDARADLYSVGIILYKAVTGRVPYNAKTLPELVVKLSEAEPVDASCWVADLDEGFLLILRKAIERDPDKRYQSADAFLADLDQWRLSAQAAQLPFFTEDGMISTIKGTELNLIGNTEDSSMSSSNGASLNMEISGSHTPLEADSALHSLMGPDGKLVLPDTTLAALSGQGRSDISVDQSLALVEKAHRKSRLAIVIMLIGFACIAAAALYVFHYLKSTEQQVALGVDAGVTGDSGGVGAMGQDQGDVDAAQDVEGDVEVDQALVAQDAAQDAGDDVQDSSDSEPSKQPMTNRKPRGTGKGVGKGKTSSPGSSESEWGY